MALRSDEDRTLGRALVLGGGGVTGIAWMTGVLLGLEDEGVEGRSAERIIGTSAGAAVAAQVTSGLSLAELFDRQVDPAKQVVELRPDVSYLRLAAAIVPALLARRDVTRFRQRIGRMALRAKTVEPEVRRRVIAARLPSQEWPAVSLALLAADAESGELRCFDRKSGVDLVDAVGASCAVPGVWPPVRIQGRSYVDGGVPSADNAAFAAGHASVLVLSPVGGTRAGALSKRLRDEVSALEAGGSRVLVLTPDAASRVAIGRNPLDPARRAGAAVAGRDQGRREAGRVGARLGGGS